MGESILSGLFVLSINWHDCVLLLVGVFNTCTPRKGRRLKLSSTKERNVVSVCDRQRVETWRRPRHALKEMSLFFHSLVGLYGVVPEQSHVGNGLAGEDVGQLGKHLPPLPRGANSWRPCREPWRGSVKIRGTRARRVVVVRLWSYWNPHPVSKVISLWSIDECR